MQMDSEKKRNFLKQFARYCESIRTQLILSRLNRPFVRTAIQETINITSALPGGMYCDYFRRKLLSISLGSPPHSVRAGYLETS